jgi:hypothetical protein
MAPNPRRWWVYDLPVQRDPLFVVALVLGVISLAGTLANRDAYGEAAFVITVLLAFPMTVLWVGIIGGTVREFRRGRRQGR